NYISQKLTDKIDINMRAENNLWLAYTYARLVLSVLYLISLFSVIAVLLLQVRDGKTQAISATALAIAYIHNTQILLKIIGPFRRYMRGWTAVKDLFNFIHNFGKQGYPVLGDSNSIIEKSATICIKAHGVSFDYQTARLFNNHSFVLNCSLGQPN